MSFSYTHFRVTMADTNSQTADARSEESSSDDWQLNPLFINHIPT